MTILDNKLAKKNNFDDQKTLYEPNFRSMAYSRFFSSNTTFFTPLTLEGPHLDYFRCS